MENIKSHQENSVLKLIKNLEKKTNKVFSFGFDDIVCLFNEDYKSLITFLKKHSGDDDMRRTTLDIIDSVKIIENGELFIKGTRM